MAVWRQGEGKRMREGRKRRMKKDIVDHGYQAASLTIKVSRKWNRFSGSIALTGQL